MITVPFSAAYQSHGARRVSYLRAMNVMTDTRRYRMCVGRSSMSVSVVRDMYTRWGWMK